MNINKVFDYDDFNTPDFLETYKINVTPVTKDVASFVTLDGVHISDFQRKHWENLILTYGLRSLGCFSGEKVALGLGTLGEPLIFTYTNYFSHVYATDIAFYPDHFWGQANYKPEEVYNLTNINYDRSKLTVLPMDMTKISFADNTFDVVWSSSSVEHVGELKDVLACFKGVERVLKPGGICGMTVEWNVDNTDTIVKFHNVLCFDMQVLDVIGKHCPKLKLVEPMSTTRSDNIKNKEPDYLRGKTHFFDGYQIVDFTSASIFWKKEK